LPKGDVAANYTGDDEMLRAKHRALKPHYKQR